MSDAQSLKDFFAAWTMTDADGRDATIAAAVGDRIHSTAPRTEAPLTDLDTRGKLSCLVGCVGEGAQ